MGGAGGRLENAERGISITEGVTKRAADLLPGGKEDAGRGGGASWAGRGRPNRGRLWPREECGGQHRRAPLKSPWAGVWIAPVPGSCRQPRALPRI